MLATEHKTEILGIPYDSVISPSQRIEMFLRHVEESLEIAKSFASPGFISGIEHIENIAKIMFSEEQKVINLRKN